SRRGVSAGRRDAVPHRAGARPGGIRRDGAALSRRHGPVQTAGRAGPAALSERGAVAAPLQRQHPQAAHGPDEAARSAGDVSVFREAPRSRLCPRLRGHRGGGGAGNVPVGVRAPGGGLVEKGPAPLGRRAGVPGLGVAGEGRHVYAAQTVSRPHMGRTTYKLLDLGVRAYNALIARGRRPPPVSPDPDLRAIRARAAVGTDISSHLEALYVVGLAAHPRLIVELGVRGGESTFVFERVARRSGADLV